MFRLQGVLDVLEINEPDAKIEGLLKVEPI
jgi:hypothetical protein